MSNWETFKQWITTFFATHNKVKCVECGRVYILPIDDKSFPSNDTKNIVNICGESCFTLYINKNTS